MYPTLTRLELVQRWAVLQIPYWDQIPTEVASWIDCLSGKPTVAVEVATKIGFSLVRRESLKGICSTAQWLDEP